MSFIHHSSFDSSSSSSTASVTDQPLSSSASSSSPSSSPSPSSSSSSSPSPSSSSSSSSSPASVTFQQPRPSFVKLATVKLENGTAHKDEDEAADEAEYEAEAEAEEATETDNVETDELELELDVDELNGDELSTDELEPNELELGEFDIDQSDIDDAETDISVVSKSTLSLYKRRCLYQEAIEFSQTADHNLYDLLMSVSSPSDPSAMVTAPDKDTMLSNHSASSSAASESSELSESHFHQEQPGRKGSCTVTELFFLLVCDYMGTAISISPVAFAFTGRGVVVYIMCIILWFAVVVPLLQFQTALAQFMQSGPVRAYASIHPRAGGIGITLTLMAFLRSIGILKVFGEALIYIYGSLHPTLPYLIPRGNHAVCQPFYGNHAECVLNPLCTDFDTITMNGTCIANPLSSAREFYERYVGNPPASSDTQVALNVPLLLSCLVAAVLAAIVLCVGLRFISQLATFTTICTFAIYCYLTFVVFLTPGGTAGMRIFFYNTNWMEFLSLETWAIAAIAVVRTGVVVYGVQSIMPSYTRIGENTMLLPLVIAGIFIFLSSFSVMVLYGISGMLYSTNLKYGLYAFNAAFNRPNNATLIRQIVRDNVVGPMLESTVKGFLSEACTESLVFILYAWGMGQAFGPWILCSLFYFAISLSSLVSFACSALLVVSSIRENIKYKNTENTKAVLIVIFAMFSFLIPTFFYKPNENTILYGRSFILASVAAFIYYGSPIASASQVVAACSVFGFKKQALELPKFGGPVVFILLAVGITISVIVDFLTSNLVVPIVAVVLIFMLMFTIVIFISKMGLHSFDENNLKLLLIGDAEAVRTKFNGILIAYTQPFYGPRFPYVWPWMFKFLVFTTFVATIPAISLDKRVHFGNYRGDALFPRYVEVAMGLAIASPIFIVLLFPALAETMLPPREKRWSFRKMKRDATLAVSTCRQSTSWFWEEFLSPNTIWQKSDRIKRITVER